jgi:TatD DNase family protein
MFIDTHAHLVASEFDADREEVIDRARDAGVDAIIIPATDVASSRGAIKLAEKHDFLFACVGIHPHEAQNATDGAVEEIEELCSHPKVVAIGEIGLDYYYDFSPRNIQHRIFREQVELADRQGLPIVIHTRDSTSSSPTSIRDAVEIIRTVQGKNQKSGGRARNVLRGVFHCFSGDAAMAREIIEMGFLVSFPGIVTFKNSAAATTVQELGIKNIMLETDSPYLAPVPLRGKRNEPANIKLIAEKVGEICGETPEAVARKTTETARILFLLGNV